LAFTCGRRARMASYLFSTLASRVSVAGVCRLPPTRAHSIGIPSTRIWLDFDQQQWPQSVPLTGFAWMATAAGAIPPSGSPSSFKGGSTAWQQAPACELQRRWSRRRALVAIEHRLCSAACVCMGCDHLVERGDVGFIALICAGTLLSYRTLSACVLQAAQRSCTCCLCSCGQVAAEAEQELQVRQPADYYTVLDRCLL
jgi:hypothetical protein